MPLNCDSRKPNKQGADKQGADKQGTDKQVTENSLSTHDDFWQMSAEDCQCLAEQGVDLPMHYNQLKCYLPHRYPFMLVDRVTACRPNKCIVGYKNVTINEPFFQGHFPDEPIMPGVLVIEAMAQLSGILSFISEGVTYKDGYLFLFAGIDKVRFKKPVGSGDKLDLQSELIMHKHDVYKFSTKALVDDTLVANAQLTIVRQNQSLKPSTVETI